MDEYESHKGALAVDQKVENHSCLAFGFDSVILKHN